MAEAREESLSGFGLGIGKRQRMAWHSVGILGHHLYIEGGEVSTWVGGEPAYNNTQSSLPLNKTLSIPLNQAWTSATVNFTETSLPDDMPSVNRPALWIDEERNVLYRWGGQQRKDIPFESGHKTKLYMLEADGNGGGKWTTKDPADSGAFWDIKAATCAASASCDGLGFNIGGFANNSTGDYQLWSDEVVHGVVTYNMSTADWRNDTASTQQTSGIDVSVRGKAVCIQGFARSPLVMLLGGVENKKDRNYRDMAKPMFFDPSTPESRYEQVTVYDSTPPVQREDFCAVGARGKNGSYEIYVYGGYYLNGSNKQYFDDAWILSIPAFMWFKAPSSGTKRMRHACVVAGKRQMISIGGVAENGATDSFKTDDDWDNGIRIFDMVDLTWKDMYDPNLGDYDSPEIVKEWYRSGKSSPINGDLKNILGHLGNTTNTTDLHLPPTGLSVGAIAGITVGGVAALVIGLWIVWRRWNPPQDQKKRRYFGQDESDSMSWANMIMGNKAELHGNHEDERSQYNQTVETNRSGYELDSTSIMEMDCQRSVIRGREPISEAYA